MKKLITIVLGVLLLSSLHLNAAYLENIPKTITQPDGTTINCFVSGDEFHNWLHDGGNYTLIQSQSDGYYYYAIKDGEKIVPSEYMVGSSMLKSAAIQPGINITAEQWQQKRNRMLENAPLNSYTLKSGEAEMNINQLCIYIRFSDDAEFTKDTAMYYDWMNDEDPSAVSMINYFDEVSYGKVEVRSHFFPRSNTSTVVSYQDPNPRGFFQPYNETTNPIGYDDNASYDSEASPTKREWDLLERTIEYFKANYSVPVGVDMDHDDNGIIDNIEFFVLGEAGAWSSLLWPHNWSIQDRTVTIDGLQVRNYNFQIENITDQRGVGVLSHEMGHAVGYPDLYHYYDSPYSPVGPWDIMASTATAPQSFGAYTKFKYGGWISSIPEITTDGVYTLNSIDSATNNCYKIASPYSSTEYYVVEYRKQAGRFESSIPGSGLLVYRINTLNNGNASAPDEVFIYRPGGTPGVDGDLYIANFSSESGRTAINNTTDPIPFLNDGTFGGLYISEVSSAAGETISFRVDFDENALLPSFSADVTAGLSPLTVNFTDETIGTPTNWEWDFDNDGTIDSYDQNPQWTYNDPGLYTVSFTASNEGETKSETKTDYINVVYGGPLKPPTSLMVDNSGYASWVEPGTGNISHTNGNYGTSLGTDSEASWIAASRFDVIDLASYYGSSLTAMNIFISSPDFTFVEARVYEGGSLGDPGTLIYAQDITSDIVVGNWTNHILTAPLPLVEGNEYWIAYYIDASADHPSALDSGPVVAGKGDWIFFGSWQEITAYGFNNNWMIEGVVENIAANNFKDVPANKIFSTPPKAMITNGTPSALVNDKLLKIEKADPVEFIGYNIYLDDSNIGNTGDLFWNFEELTAGTTYKVGVSALYTEGESSIVEESFMYVTASTISDIQYTTVAGDNGTYPSPLVGQQVLTTGIVTTPWFTGGANNFFISSNDGEPWGGLLVYNANQDAQMGDEVLVSGLVTEYNGKTEILDAQITILSSGNAIYPAIEVSTNDLSSAATAEAYEGCLVKVQELSVTQATDQYMEFFVDDGSGSCRVDDQMFSYPAYEVGDEFDFIIGILEYRFSTYRILPRFDVDVIKKGTI